MIDKSLAWPGTDLVVTGMTEQLQLYSQEAHKKKMGPSAVPWHGQAFTDFNGMAGTMTAALWGSSRRMKMEIEYTGVYSQWYLDISYAARVWIYTWHGQVRLNSQCSQHRAT